MVKASTGLGLGIVAGGRVLGGHLGAAGEIGHTRIDAADGLPCRCGATGCLEAVAGGWALVGRLGGAPRRRARARPGRRWPSQGDAEARGLLRESGRRLGEVLAVTVNLLNPQAVVVGGDMAAAFDILRRGACARASTRRPRRWPPATCSSCPPPTATGPAWSAAPRWPWSTCSAPPPWTPGWPRSAALTDARR